MSIAEQDRVSRELPAAGDAPAQGRPRRGRPARAHILMALAGLLTAVAVYVVLQDADPGQRVLVAAAELQAGTVVPPDALAVTTVDVSDAQATRLVPAAQREAVVGQVAANHLLPGDLIGLSDLRQPAAPEDRRAMALPVGRSRAVAGELRTGDRVDVISVEDGVARYVATGLPVIASGGGEAFDQDWTLTVSVDEQSALALARALAETEVTITRATGATPADPEASDGGVDLLTPEADEADEDAERRARRARREERAAGDEEDAAGDTAEDPADDDPDSDEADDTATESGA
jgi:Flp pilus assembly protein CpaB